MFFYLIVLIQKDKLENLFINKLKSNKQHIENSKSIENLIEEKCSNYSVPNGKDKESVWGELSVKLVEKSKILTKRSKDFSIIYKVAAAAIILVLSSITYLYSDTSYSTKYAEIKMVNLPDGSSVFLQADSRISLNEKQWETNREIKLVGEAYFSVKKGSTFTVETGNGNIKVLGTRFNVVSRGNTFEVGCVSGKVSVNLKNSLKSKILTKGMQTWQTLSGQLSEPVSVNVEHIINRQKGEFYFEQADLSLVFEELERQFDVKVKYTGIKNRKFTGYFSNKDIETALKMVCNPMNLDYEINNRLIIIKGLAKSNQ
ncbi:MAG: hypothetical protein DRI95_04495 [Bacteroidetes bacterium]|nr:MAG: hypothetical protein DRI95_04495 [Bacteroidota bacterium]